MSNQNKAKKGSVDITCVHKPNKLSESEYQEFLNDFKLFVNKEFVNKVEEEKNIEEGIENKMMEERNLDIATKALNDFIKENDLDDEYYQDNYQAIVDNMDVKYEFKMEEQEL